MPTLCILNAMIPEDRTALQRPDAEVLLGEPALYTDADGQEWAVWDDNRLVPEDAAWMATVVFPGDGAGSIDLGGGAVRLPPGELPPVGPPPVDDGVDPDPWQAAIGSAGAIIQANYGVPAEWAAAEASE